MREYMTVGDLKTILGEYSDDTKVLLSRDSEGNGFSPCDFSERSGTFEEDIDMKEEVMCMSEDAKTGSFVVFYPTL